MFKIGGKEKANVNWMEQGSMKLSKCFVSPKKIQNKNFGWCLNQVLCTIKPPNSGHLRVLKNLSVTERYTLLGGDLKRIVTFGIKCSVRYSWHVR